MQDQGHQLKPGFALSEFSSLANLLSLRNGGGLDPTSVDNFDELDDQTDNVLQSHADTTSADFLAPYQNDGLRQQFLNRLSELLAREKGGKHVSGAILRENETEGSVDIWVARNCSLKERNRATDSSDNDLLRTLEETLSSVSKGEPGNAPVEVDL